MSSPRSAKRRAAPAELGYEVPRLWTRPLRKLTAETSHGFHVIEFAAVFLGTEGTTLRRSQP